MGDVKRARRAAVRGFPTRRDERQHRMRRRLEQSATAEEQLAAAFDWFRSAARHADVSVRGGLMREMASTLTGGAQAIERGDRG